MPNLTVQTTSYQTLLRAIQGEVKSGIRKIERLAEVQKIRTYWNIGRHINAYLSSKAQKRGAVGRFYKSLSADLQMNSRTLQHCEQFFRYFPRLKIQDGLSWSHYMYLLRVDDATKRQKWLKRLSQNPLNAEEFRLRLIDVAPVAPAALRKKIPVVRGRLYTYRLVAARPFQKKAGDYLVDCGFSNRIEAPPHEAALHNKRLYLSQKDGPDYSLKVSDAKVDALFTFKAHVLRVIDADTILALVDQGFGIWTEQRLRFQGIDAPEMSTLAGQKAKQAVETLFSKLSFVIVKTYKSDKYDRYLVDVFYMPGEQDPHIVASQGKLLNQEMLDRDLARPWSL